MNSNPEGAIITEEILNEFQDIVNLLAEVPAVPAALILKIDSSQSEVLCACESEGNPFKKGDRFPVEDRFREEILTTGNELPVTTVLHDKNKAEESSVYRGMVSCLSSVLLLPGEEIFGVICVMDAKETTFNSLTKRLLTRFKKEVESLLRRMYSEVESEKKPVDFKGAEEKLESVGILAGGIAQDFNSLLSVIIGNISLARMEVPPGEKVYDLLLESEKASCQAADIAEKLITFSEGGWLVRREERLAAILDELAASNSLKSRSGIIFKTHVPFVLSPIFVDEGQFKQALLNVFLNAADAMPEGGEVKISAADVTVEPGDIPALQPGRYVRLRIADKGPGIPKKYLNKIFDPYFSTKNSLDQKGMGLGLSISYSIIKKHEGWITIESEEGTGTTVYIYVPVYSEEKERNALNV